MSKYDPIWKYLKEKNQDRCQLSYEEMKEILGFTIDHSFLSSKKEAEQYGYIVEKISLKEKWIIFQKVK